MSVLLCYVLYLLHLHSTWEFHVSQQIPNHAQGAYRSLAALDTRAKRRNPTEWGINLFEFCHWSVDPICLDYRVHTNEVIERSQTQHFFSWHTPISIGTSRGESICACIWEIQRLQSLMCTVATSPKSCDQVRDTVMMCSGKDAS